MNVIEILSFLMDLHETETNCLGKDALKQEILTHWNRFTIKRCWDEISCIQMTFLDKGSYKLTNYSQLSLPLNCQVLQKRPTFTRQILYKVPIKFHANWIKYRPSKDSIKSAQLRLKPLVST